MHLLEPLMPGAYRLAVSMLRSESEAEDAVQESVFKAWRNFRRFRRDAELRPWLFTIVATSGLYFQHHGVWYSLDFFTAPAIKQYSGPGTYPAHAALYYPKQKLYEGTVQLAVAVDHRPDSGSVQGTLDRVGTATQEPSLSVGGSWTCVPDPMLGPA